MIATHASHFWRKLAAVVRCLDVSRPIIDVFQMLRANGRMLRSESRYSSNDGCALHYYAGRGMVISSIQKITRPTIPGIR